MRQIIADPVALGHRPLVVTSDEGARSIILEASGHAVRIGPEEAKQLAWALVHAVGLVEQAERPASGEADEADDLDDDLPWAV